MTIIHAFFSAALANITDWNSEEAEGARDLAQILREMGTPIPDFYFTRTGPDKLELHIGETDRWEDRPPSEGGAI